MAGESSISEEAVQTRTGRSWSEWLRLLDRWGAAKKGHRATAIWLHESHGLSAWWSQTITVRHEQERGLRDKHQRPDGYSVSVTRLVAASAARTFDALTQPADLSRWFTRGAQANVEVGGSYSNQDGDRGRFLAVARPRRIRMSWDNAKHAPGTIVEFTIAPASGGKVRAEVTHSRLASRRDAEKMKDGWSWAFDSLRSFLETGKAIRVEEWEAARAAARAKKPKAKRATARVASKKPARSAAPASKRSVKAKRRPAPAARPAKAARPRARRGAA
jgi:uncharacterized protein YndB with AHSA1/START domain